jgi:intracellular sulfur oxidation DsrE/DsrF family protein
VRAAFANPCGMIRSSFIAVGAMSAAGFALSATEASAATPAPVSAAVPFSFDRAAFDAQLAKPYPHRQLFGSTKLADGAVLHYMENSLRAYADGFGEGAGTLHVAAVLYGTSLALAAQDAMWPKYDLAGVLRTEGETLQSSAGSKNPYAARVAALVAQGATFFICNNALSGAAYRLAKLVAHGEPTRAQVVTIHDDLAAHLLPGAMVVPAGVAAINAGQEARFTYLQATIG